MMGSVTVIEEVTQREMTLKEYVEQLPPSHGVRQEYEGLLKDQMMLQALHMGGVDNWEWYGESLEPYWEWEEEQERNK